MRKNATFSAAATLLSAGRSDGGSYKRVPTEENSRSARRARRHASSHSDVHFESQFYDFQEKLTETDPGSRSMHWVASSNPKRLVLGWQERNPELLESPPVQAVTIALILSNAVVIGLETDRPDMCRWNIVENIFLVFFTIELALRVYLLDWAFLRFHGNNDFFWNLFDVAIVGMGFVNIAASLVAGAEHVMGGDSSLFRIIRMLRILRVLRIIRIVRFLKQLYLLAYGFIEGAMAVFWVTILASFMLYICAVVLVRSYGKAADLEENEEDALLLDEKFGSIPKTMFSLFQLISSPDLSPYRHTMFRNPCLVIFLISFIVLGSFGINGILVALINESILEKNQARLESDRIEREAKRKHLQKACGDIFDGLDVNHNRVLPREELIHCVEDLAEVFDSCGVNFQKADLNQMFYIMDHNDTGIIERNEFVQGVLELCDQIRPMSIMELHYQVSKCANKVEQADLKVETMVKAAEQHELRLDRLQSCMDLQGQGAKSSSLSQRDRQSPLASAGDMSLALEPPRTVTFMDGLPAPHAAMERGASPAASSSTAPAGFAQRGSLYEPLRRHCEALKLAHAHLEGLLRDPKRLDELEHSGGMPLHCLNQTLHNLQRSNLEAMGTLLDLPRSGRIVLESPEQLALCRDEGGDCGPERTLSCSSSEVTPSQLWATPPLTRDIPDCASPESSVTLSPPPRSGAAAPELLGD